MVSSARPSSFNTERVDHLYQDPHARNVRFSMHYGDMIDATNLIRVIQKPIRCGKRWHGPLSPTRLAEWFRHFGDVRADLARLGGATVFFV
jgi:hypothetical protein